MFSPFSFLILLIWFFSLFFLMSLANGLFILFIFSKNQLLFFNFFSSLLFFFFWRIYTIYSYNMLLLEWACVFFVFFLILIFTLFYFTILYWFCHTLTWIHHGCTCDPKHEPPSHLPPHNISLGHLRAPAPSMLYPTSDIDWRFDSYMIVYMFQCHSPKSSHPLPLPLSPKVRSTYLCLFCCLAYRAILSFF